MEKIPKVDIPQLVENTKKVFFIIITFFQFLLELITIISTTSLIVLKKAGIYFKSADSAQNSIQIYRKVAMYLEKNNAIDLGLELLKQAINDAEEHEQPHYIDDLWTTYISWMVQREDYDAAIQSFQTQIYKNKENPKKSPHTVLLNQLLKF